MSTYSKTLTHLTIAGCQYGEICLNIYQNNQDMTQKMKRDFLISQGWHTKWNDNNWTNGKGDSGYSLDEAYELVIKYQKIKV